MPKAAASDPTDVPAGVADERVDALYGLPLDEFTAARDALAKDLRKEGQRAGAEWVKALRKPSGPAWVVNQLARSQTSEAEHLSAAGEALRETHERLLAGNGSADDIRAAAERQGEAVGALLDKAEGLLDSSGRSPSEHTLERVRQTLEAAAHDEEARAAFAAGRLTHESRAVGLGLLGGAALAPPARFDRANAKSGEVAERSAAEDARGAERAAASRAKERAKLEEQLQAAREDERSHRRTVETAERDAEQARREAERAQAHLEETEAELERARAAHLEASSRVEELGRAAESEGDGA